MTRYIDITGHRYGRLTVIALHDKRGNFRRWLCRCDCGTECIKYGHQMRAGQASSCGCAQREAAKRTGIANSLSLSGRRFGRLVVVCRDSSVRRHSTWLCQCDCGKEVVVVGNSLLTGNTTSCGCLHKEMVSQMFTNPNLTDEERALNQNRGIAVPGLHLWRKAVYERDGYTCQACGDSPSNHLVAHHMDGWDWCKERRLDESNGATACEDCHKVFHSEYGYGDNTESQWREFVASRQLVEAVA